MITLFSDEQLVALSKILDDLILDITSLKLTLLSTITVTLPTPTPIFGIPDTVASLTLFCDPVTIILSTCFINSWVISFVIGTLNVCIKFLGAFIFDNSLFKKLINFFKTL